MKDWAWIEAALASAIHDRQLAEWGGPAGTRDAGALESALARPQNLVAYGEPDAPQIAASYASGIVRNHPFVDGNKRTAWVLARVFLMANGLELQFDKVEAIATMEGLAAGGLTEDEFAEWLRDRVAAS